jgi:hypothetical protein
MLQHLLIGKTPCPFDNDHLRRPVVLDIDDGSEDAFGPDPLFWRIFNPLSL